MDHEPLTRAQIAHLEEHLRALAQELEAALQDSAHAAQPVGLDKPIGRLSRMDEMQQQAMVQAGRREQQIRQQQVQAALRKIAGGTYGECAQCEEPIGLKRLTARPEAASCLACQQSRERRGQNA